MQAIHGEPSYQLATPEVDLAVTARGGHIAPVNFHLPGRDVAPYSISPWEPAEFPDQPVLLAVLRGDFLCLPFGGQDAGPPHGDTANGNWSLIASNDRNMVLALDAHDTGAHIVKSITIRAGQHATYIEHRISQLDGRFNYGTHPILDLSTLADGTGRISTSPFRWASTYPGAFANPSIGETQSLAEGAEFSDLTTVPLAAGGTTDLTRYPARRGYEDLVMMVSDIATESQPFAWSAVVFDGYVWFSLKNPSDFPATLFWISNGGRTAAPWNGRHFGRIGIEDVCSHFCDGVAVSRQNRLASNGIPTTREFQRGQVVTLRTLHATALVPDDFGIVNSITPDGSDAVVLTSASGSRVVVPLDWRFVTSSI